MSKKPAKSKNKANSVIEEEEKVEKTFEFHPDAAQYISEEAERTGKTETEILEEVFRGNVAIVEFEETTGQASLVGWWKPYQLSQAIGEKPKDAEKVRQDYRVLRENFPPVSAGINFHKKFTLGGGFTVVIDDPTDKHQIAMRTTINEFNDLISQDYYTRGLDRLLKILVDDALTVGAGAAEIVYEGEDKFTDDGAHPENMFYNWVVRAYEVKDPSNPQKKITVYETREPTPQEWKKLGGISRLKILSNADRRLIPHRDSNSFEVEYWTLDAPSEQIIQKAKEKKLQVPKAIYFHPWKIFWMSWNTRGTDLIGQSLIKPVYGISKIMIEIIDAIGKGFRRWADRKYFFICGSDKRPWGKIHTRNFLKAMKLMIKKKWIGIPVPQGFDVKDIGGDVFEGKNILDFLLSMICAGMCYPRDFLEQGRTRASDKAWLAWQVTYGDAQLEIRRHIEHQLWEKHLWCRFGLSYRVPKQGVKVRKREKRNTYVPKIQWRAESKWHMETRLKMDTQILNVANPVGPHLKLAVEQDIAKTMGWRDVLFPSFEELERQLKRDERVERLKQRIELLKVQAQLLHAEQHPEELVKTPLSTEEDEKKTKEEKLKEQGEERLAEGVSRTTKETGKLTQKGKAKELGSTRLSAEARGKKKKSQRFGETETDDKNSIPKIPVELTVKVEHEPLKIEGGEISLKGKVLEVKGPDKPIEIKNSSELKITSDPIKIMTEVESKPVDVNVTTKSEVDVKSEPLKVEVEAKSSKEEIEETVEREKAKLELIKGERELLEEKRKTFKEEQEEKKQKRKRDRKLAEEKRKTLKKIREKAEKIE
jgi:hypothetical protein